MAAHNDMPKALTDVGYTYRMISKIIKIVYAVTRASQSPQVHKDQSLERNQWQTDGCQTETQSIQFYEETVTLHTSGRTNYVFNYLPTQKNNSP